MDVLNQTDFVVISCLSKAVCQWSRILAKPIRDWCPYDVLTDYRQASDLRIFLLSSIVGLGPAGPLAALTLAELPDAVRGDKLQEYMGKSLCWKGVLERLATVTVRRCSVVGDVVQIETDNELLEGSDLYDSLPTKGEIRLMKTTKYDLVPCVSVDCLADEDPEDTANGIFPLLRERFPEHISKPVYVKVASKLLLEEWFKVLPSEGLRRISAIEAIENLT